MTEQEKKDCTKELIAKIGKDYKALKASTIELAEFFKGINDLKGYDACQTALTELHKTVLSQYRPICKRVVRIQI